MSSFSDGFTYGWRQGHAYSAIEAERRARLNAPPAPNPPELMKSVRVRVLKAFGLGAGRVAEVGEVVELGRADAESLAAIRKVEILA